MKPVLCLVLKCCGKNLEYKSIVVAIKDHGVSVVHQVPIWIFISFENGEISQLNFRGGYFCLISSVNGDLLMSATSL